MVSAMTSCGVAKVVANGPDSKTVEWSHTSTSGVRYLATDIKKAREIREKCLPRLATVIGKERMFGVHIAGKWQVYISAIPPSLCLSMQATEQTSGRESHPVFLLTDSTAGEWLASTRAFTCVEMRRACRKQTSDREESETRERTTS